MQKLGLPDDQPIQHGMISKSLESAQRKVEGNNFDIRKHLVEYDDVMNKQREYVYGKRRMILGDHDVKNEILDYLDESAEFLVNENVNAQTEEFDYAHFIKNFNAIVPIDSKFKNQIKKETPDEIARSASKFLGKTYGTREKEFTPEIMRNIERSIYLHIIDTLWIDHLDAIDNLREGIGLRAYGQTEPLVEYKKESYKMFQQFLAGIRSEIVNMIFKVRIQPTEAAPTPERVGVPIPPEADKLRTGKQESKLTKAAKKAKEVGGSEKLEEPQNLADNANASIMRRESAHQAEKNQTILKKTKVGRNDPCPCGSVDTNTGRPKKYKKCCGK